MNRESKLVMEHLGKCQEKVARPCYDCGRVMQGKRQSYQYTECGLSSVTLLNVVVFQCDCGVRVPEIPGRLFDARGGFVKPAEAADC